MPFTLTLVCLWLFLSCGCSQPPRVVVYTSQDQVYSQPILQQFEQQTGIEVLELFDSEAVKTVGLANRLLAERARPQCDVFWSNEEFRTRQLAAKGLFRATNGWAARGYRSRRIVINTNLLAPDQAPRSVLELTNAIWRGKVALAYPLFGTTATHFLALRHAWGSEGWERWCRGLAQNDVFLVDGNSVVVQLVGRGEAPVGLTDSDDVAAGQREGLPLIALPMTADTLLIPNTVAVIRNAPNPNAAQQLFEFLLHPDNTQRLVRAGALEGATSPSSGQPVLSPDWSAMLTDLAPATETIKNIFLR